MSPDLFIGWLLGLLGSLLTGVIMYWLEGRREERRERLKQHGEQVRTALSWASDGKRTSLRGFYLKGANLSGKDLSEADLESANLDEIIGWALDLRRANLRAASFRKAKIKHADFRGAVFHRADFAGAILVDVDFTGADVRDTDLTTAHTLEACVWDGLRRNERTRLPQHVRDSVERQAADSQPASGADTPS